LSDRATIKIEGLREFQAALRQMDSDLPKQLRLTLNEAGGIIVDYVQAHIEVKSGRARASIKARSSQRTGQVAIGGNRAPYAPWLDFGGEGRIKGRPAKRPFIKEGRYVYRGLRLKSEDIVAVMARGLTELAAGAGLDVT
jgi:hypothetical protein